MRRSSPRRRITGRNSQLALSPMSVLALITICGFSFLVGALIGGVGVGGVLLVPALVYLGGVDIHVAIAAAMFSYLFTGVVGATVYARRGLFQFPFTPKASRAV